MRLKILLFQVYLEQVKKWLLEVPVPKTTAKLYIIMISKKIPSLTFLYDIVVIVIVWFTLQSTSKEIDIDQIGKYIWSACSYNRIIF